MVHFNYCTVLKNKEIVVTGGAGFIGSHLVDSLVKQNKVKVLDNLSTGRKDNVDKSADFTKVDITSFEAVKQNIGEPDLIFHLAASAHTKATSAGWDDPQFDCEANAKSTVNIFEAARQMASKPKIVYASSAAVYGTPENPPMTEEHPKNPISPYGVHKYTGEKHMSAYCSQHNLDISAVRIFNAFGERQPRYVMYDFLKKLQNNSSELEVLGTGQQVRDYCHVDDAVKALETVGEKGQTGEAYNLSGENVISINELAEMMIDITGVNATYYNTDESWKGDPQRLEADISKIKQLGFEPEIGLETGLKRLKNWFESTHGKIS